MLLLGRPGVGKTTVIREIARLLADEMGKRVVIVDTSNEIGGEAETGRVSHALPYGYHSWAVSFLTCLHGTPQEGGWALHGRGLT